MAEFTSEMAMAELLGIDTMAELEKLTLSAEKCLEETAKSKKSYESVIKESGSKSDAALESKSDLDRKSATSADLVSKISTKVSAVSKEKDISVTKVIRSLSAFHDGSEKKRLQKIFEVSQTLDICFVIDATGSMSPIFEAARQNFVKVMMLIKSTNPTLAYRVCLVAYRDVCDSEQFVVIPFTTDVDKFTSELGRVSCGGGGDECEDVIGGLHKASELEFTSYTRLLFMCCDAPCHGRQYHVGRGDSLPGGISGQLPVSHALGLLKQKKVEFNFWRLNFTTDKMIQKFNEESGSEYITSQDFDIATASECFKASLKMSITKSLSASASKAATLTKRDISRTVKAVLSSIPEETPKTATSSIVAPVPVPVSPTDVKASSSTETVPVAKSSTIKELKCVSATGDEF